MSAENVRRLVINADDFGRTVEINDAVLTAAARGIVTSASLMVNYPAVADAARRVRAPGAPAVGVGLHVQMSGGPLALSPEAAPTLYGPAGAAPPRPQAHADADAGQVLAEVRAQLDRFREVMGSDPTHLDGHHHCHRVPVIFRAISLVAREVGCPVRRVDAPMAAELRALGVAGIDRFTDRFWGEEATLTVLLELLAEVEPGWNEIMCHPGRVDYPELETLTHPSVAEAIASRGIELVDFSALPSGCGC